MKQRPYRQEDHISPDERLEGQSAGDKNQTQRNQKETAYPYVMADNLIKKVCGFEKIRILHFLEKPRNGIRGEMKTMTLYVGDETYSKNDFRQDVQRTGGRLLTTRGQ